MHPALKITLSVFVLCILAVGFSSRWGNASAQNSNGFTSVSYAVSRSKDLTPRDPVENELALYGKRGQLISQARAQTISILSSENSCSAWFRQATPQPEEFFRTLRIVVDSSGQSEIIKLDPAFGAPEYFHPYIAHAGQDVGPGSAIVLNANGAFFKDYAIVRSSNAPVVPASMRNVRPLTVADMLGDTDQVRVLTLLHEFGHIINLLPYDSGTFPASLLSVKNTKTVWRHCKSQIEDRVKHH